jgi:hypothetical protein
VVIRDYYNNRQKRMASKDVIAKQAADIHASASSPLRSAAHRLRALSAAANRKSTKQNR